MEYKMQLRIHVMFLICLVKALVEKSNLMPVFYFLCSIFIISSALQVLSGSHVCFVCWTDAGTRLFKVGGIQCNVIRVLG